MNLHKQKDQFLIWNISLHQNYLHITCLSYYHLIGNWFTICNWSNRMFTNRFLRCKKIETAFSLNIKFKSNISLSITSSIFDQSMEIDLNKPNIIFIEIMKEENKSIKLPFVDNLLHKVFPLVSFIVVEKWIISQ